MLANMRTTLDGSGITEADKVNVPPNTSLACEPKPGTPSLPEMLTTIRSVNENGDTLAGEKPEVRVGPERLIVVLGVAGNRYDPRGV